MNSTTVELYQLYKAQKLTPFAQELYAALEQIFEVEGIRGWSISDAARKLDVGRMTVRGWLRGHNIPDADSCRRIAAVTGLPEEHWLSLAGHPTFNQLIADMDPYRFTWQDGKYVYDAIKLTQERRWRFSRSPFKMRAEFELARGWKRRMDEEQLHELALTVAILIERWATDPQREIPLYQRQVAMSA